MKPVEELLKAALSATDDRVVQALNLLLGTHAPDPEPRVYEPYLTRRELARRLGVSAVTLWRWEVPGHDLGGRQMYKLSEVEEYLRTEEFQRRVAALRAERKMPSPTANGRNVE